MTEQTVAELLTFPPVASELAQRYREAGHELFLVGGAVRDALLQRETGELDFATDATPAETVRILQGWSDSRYMQGVKYGTVGARKGDLLLEITTFREEVYSEESRRPAVTFAKTIEGDLERRDFTINAMAVRLPESEFVDPHRGLFDLAHKLLRTPLEPEVSFGEDPLRMLRAARFVATLGATPSPEVTAAIGEMRERLQIVSPERIAGELSKLLVGERAGAGLEMLVETGLADVFLPELPALQLEQDPVHRHKDVLRHTIAVVERADRRDLTLRLAALLHDIGKPKTRTISPEGVQFHHHEVVGARMAGERLRALRFPERVVKDVMTLVELHLRFHTYQGWTDGALRRYVRDAGPLLDQLNQLTRADCTTRNPKKAAELERLQDELEERIATLAEEENLASMRPPLDGNAIMERLGIGPGPAVGEAWQHLLEARIERGPMDAEEAGRLLDEWAKEHGIE